MPTIKRAEWFWVLTWSVAILIVINLPYFYGAMVSTPANRFSGFVIGLEDGNSYLAKMQQGRSGYWLFRLTYTPETHQGEPFFLFYILLGKVAGLTGLSNVVVFQISRLLTVPLGLFAFYYFAAYFTVRMRVRQIAWLIFSLTGGLGWLWLLLGGGAELGHMPVDLWVPDASFFLSALTYAHLPFAQGLLLLFVVTGIEFIHKGQKWTGIIAAGCGLAVSLIHPHTLPLICFILGFYILWQDHHQKQMLFAKVVRLALIASLSIPYLIYVLIVFNSNSAFISWRAQSLTYSPAPMYYLLGFGITMVFALFGFVITWPSSDPKYRFLQVWIISVPILVYLPIVLQRRFLDGYQAPMAVLAAVSFVWIVERISSQFWQRAITVLLFLGMVLTNIFLITGAVMTISHSPQNLFVSKPQIDAAYWLAERVDQDVVLASYDSGNYLPTVANVRVFVGHGPETMHSAEKQAQVELFFSEATNDTWRQRLLDQFNVTYVYYGPGERALGGFEPERATYLQKVYQNNQIVLYKYISS